MEKYEFVQEYKAMSCTTVYYTNKDGNYVINSLSPHKDIAYELFIKASSGISLENKKEILETKIINQ